MSDRQKRADDKTEVENNEHKRDFLERSGVGNWMKDALSKILSNRPKDAVDFLAQYFSSLGEKSNRLHRAYHHLTLTDYYQPMFANNVAVAYEVLSTSTGSRTPAGLTGSLYRDLLNLICSNIPPPLLEKFLRKIGPRDEEVIYPHVFHSGVTSSFVLIEYLKQTEELFRLLITQSDTDRVDEELARTLLQELQESLAIKSSEPISILKAGSKLTNDTITETLMEILVASQREHRKMMSKEEFLLSSFNIYLKEVKPLK